jgi:Zn-dependent peptidase ImmA (M78 family)/transcriptional regulator with XRE-family HTH domain
MDQAELGLRLRRAREISNVSQQQAADAIEAPRTAITQIEAGNRSVSSLELSKLAKLYRTPIASFFDDHDHEHEDNPSLVAFHRVVPGLERHPAIQGEVERCVDLFTEGVKLEALVSYDVRNAPPSYDVGAPRTIGDAIREGERIAHEERSRIGLGNAPILDVSELLLSQGIWASGLELPDEMSGLFLHHESTGLAILVNAAHPRARKRFSYAHELAHALMDRGRELSVSSRDNAADLIEKRANAFAAAFLMPRSGILGMLRGLNKGRPSRHEQTIFDVATGESITAELRDTARSQQITYTDVSLIAHHFGVSYQAAAYRMKSLRHVSSAECEELLQHEDHGREYLNALDLLDDLEAPLARPYWDRELRSEIANLAIEAFRREEISRGRLLELGRSLNFEGDRLLRLAEAACA